MKLEQKTIEILSEITYKEMMAKKGNGYIIENKEEFWNEHKEQTLELARNILRVEKTINPV